MFELLFGFTAAYNGKLKVISELMNLRSNETIERARALFNETPLAKGSGFKAAQISIEATKFNSKSRKSLFLAIALIAGALIGLFVVALNLAFRRRAMVETAGA